MLVRKRPETIGATLHLKGQGEEIKFNVTYHNRTQAEVEARLKEEAAKPNPDSLVLFVVKEWEAEYELTTAGLEEAEQDRPGINAAIMYGFYEARVVNKVKN